MQEDIEAGHAEGPEQLFTRAQEARLVHLSIANLDPDERTVLGLAYFQDCTQREISQAAGMPLGTVKTLMARAQRKLRAHLSAAAPPAACPPPHLRGNPPPSQVAL